MPCTRTIRPWKYCAIVDGVEFLEDHRTTPTLYNAKKKTEEEIIGWGEKYCQSDADRETLKEIAHHVKIQD